MKHKKIFSFEEIKKERQIARELESCGLRKFFIFTNGCFDLFHAGHAGLLNAMKNACSLNSKLLVLFQFCLFLRIFSFRKYQTFLNKFISINFID